MVVPTGSLVAYQAAANWKEFTNIVEVIFVNLEANNGYPSMPITVASANSTIAAPANPVREGYTFSGWYKEAACTNAWNFATDVVTAPITLYAKWTTATGLENPTSTNFKLYPNPATSALYVPNLLHEAKVGIIGLDGKTVKQLNSIANDGKIDISNLPKGVYLLKISSKDGDRLQKFIKQ